MAVAMLVVQSAGAFAPIRTLAADPANIGQALPANPEANSCSFNILASKGMTAWVELLESGSTQPVVTDRVVSANGEPVVVKADGLKEDTRYAFTAKYTLSDSQSVLVGSKGLISTQRKPGSTFSFAVAGDSHPERTREMFNSELYKRTLNAVTKANPDFYFMMGDDFSIDPLIDRDNATKANVEAVYNLQRQYVGALGMPLFLVNGNHEQAAKYLLDGTATNPAVLSSNARNLYYPKQVPDGFYSGDTEEVEHIGKLGDYYAFTWGDALFVVIDQYWHSIIPVDNTAKEGRNGKQNKDLWQVTLGDAQYAWLKKTLEESKSKYKFVFEHHVMGTGRGGVECATQFEWGGKDRNGKSLFSAKRPGWAMPIHELFVKTGVSIFFQGHDHLFARQELDGVVYQTCPNPADFSYSTFNKSSYKSGDILPNSGFINVTVSPTGVKADYIRTYLPKDDTIGEKNGKVAFSYSIGSVSSATPTPEPVPVQTAGVSSILGRPTTDFMTLNIIPKTDSEIAVVYGTESKKYTLRSKSVSAKAGTPFEVAVAGLKGDTKYYYAIESKTSGKTETSSESTFQTARTAGKSFVFDMQADPHLDEQSDITTYKQTLSNISADKPDFLVDLGDFSMTDKLDSKTEANIKARYTLNRSYLDPVCGSAPLFMALGNHDGEAGWDYATNQNLFKWSRQCRLAYFPNPYPNSFYSGNTTKENSRYQLDYYSWTWGDALFVVIDPYINTLKKPNDSGWGWTLGKTQYDWLRGVLEKSKAKFKFVFTHQLVGGDSQGRGGVEFAKLYEWGGNNADGTYGFDKMRPGWGKPLHRLFADTKVSAIFKGHDHFYARQELDGIVYQTLPQPSHAGDKVNTSEEYGYKSGKVIGGSGHLRVTVTTAKATVDFVRANPGREIAFSYELK